jgi:hypothetical protein
MRPIHVWGFRMLVNALSLCDITTIWVKSYGWMHWILVSWINVKIDNHVAEPCRRCIKICGAAKWRPYLLPVPAVSMTPRDPTFFCQSSPFKFTFSSNYMYVMFTYLFFCYGFPSKGVRTNNRFHKGSRSVINISAVSVTPLIPLILCVD